MATLAFFVTLALQVAAVAAAIKASDPRRRRAGRALVVASLAPVMALLGSSLLALSALVVALASWASDPGGEEGPLAPMPRPDLLRGAAFGLLVFVVLGTLARQVVTYGATSTERPDFALDGPILRALMHLTWPGLGLFMLLAMLFVARKRLAEEEV